MGVVKRATGVTRSRSQLGPAMLGKRQDLAHPHMGSVGKRDNVLVTRFRWVVVPQPAPPENPGHRQGACHARRHLAARCHRLVHLACLVREGSRCAMTILNLVAAILGISAVVYLVIALIRPERF